jgi:hypothetical protein
MKTILRLIPGYTWPVVATLVALGSLVIVLARYTQSPVAFNSDDLVMVDFCDDLLAGDDLYGWHLPGAPSLFPDVLLLLPGRLAFSSVAHVFLLYSVLLYAGVAAALAWLAHEAGLRWRSAWTGAVLGIALVMAMNLDPASEFRMIHLPRPGSHLGLMPIGLLTAAFFLRSARTGFRLIPSVFLAVVVGFAAFSDRLLLVQFLAPAGVALFLGRVVGLVSTRRLLAGALFAAMVVSVSVLVRFGLDRYGIHFIELDRGGSLVAIGWKGVRPHLARLWHDLHDQRVLQAVLVAAFVAQVACCVAGWRRMRNGQGGGGLLFGATALLISASGIVPFVLMANAPLDSFERYCFSVTVVTPLLFLLLALVVLGESRIAWARGLKAVVVVLVATLVLRNLALQKPLTLHQPYPEWIAALDRAARETGCHKGFAGYWDARQARYLSREGVCLIQVGNEGKPWFHGSNPNRVISPVQGDRHIPDIQLAVVDPQSAHPFFIHARPFEAEYGPPVRKVPLGGRELWVYDRIESVNLRHFLNAILASRLEKSEHPIGPRNPSGLGRPRSGWRARRPDDSVVVLQPDQEVSLDFVGLQHGRLIDVSGDIDAVFAVTFYQGERSLGMVAVPPLPWCNNCHPVYGESMVHARLVPVPKAVVEQGWDRATVRYKGARPKAALAHFLVYPGRAELPVEDFTPHSPPRHYPADALLSTLPDPIIDHCRQAPRVLHHMVFGPYSTLPPGRYRVEYRLQVDAPDVAGSLVTLDIVGQEVLGKEIETHRELTGRDFDGANRMKTFSLFTDLDTQATGMQFRVLTHGRAGVTVESVDLVPITSTDKVAQRR